MKSIKIILTIVMIIGLASTGHAGLKAPDNELANDGTSSLQTALRKKKLQQAPFALSAASKVLRFRGTVQGGEIDLTGALGAIVRTSSGSLTAWYDSDTTKTWTIDGGSEISFVADPLADTVTINGTDTAIEVGGF